MLSRVHKRALLILSSSLLIGIGLSWIATNHLLEYSWNQSNTSLYLIATVGVIAGALWTFIYVRQLGTKTAIFWGIIMGIACTGFAGILFLYVQFANSTLDYRAPRTIEAIVTDKWTERRVGRRLAYLISIETPLENTKSRTISLKHSMWEVVNKGDRAEFTIGQGLFWPYVSGIEKLSSVNTNPTSIDLVGKKNIYPFWFKDEK